MPHFLDGARLRAHAQQLGMGDLCMWVWTVRRVQGFLVFVTVIGSLAAIPMLKVAAQSDSTAVKVVTAILVAGVLLAGFGAFA